MPLEQRYHRMNSCGYTDFTYGNLDLDTKVESERTLNLNGMITFIIQEHPEQVMRNPAKKDLLFLQIKGFGLNGCRMKLQMQKK